MTMQSAVKVSSTALALSIGLFSFGTTALAGPILAIGSSEQNRIALPFGKRG
jgi:hypothetical protein